MQEELNMSLLPSLCKLRAAPVPTRDTTRPSQGNADTIVNPKDLDTSKVYVAIRQQDLEEQVLVHMGEKWWAATPHGETAFIVNFLNERAAFNSAKVVDLKNETVQQILRSQPTTVGNGVRTAVESDTTNGNNMKKTIERKLNPWWLAMWVL